MTYYSHSLKVHDKYRGTQLRLLPQPPIPFLGHASVENVTFSKELFILETNLYNINLRDEIL